MNDLTEFLAFLNGCLDEDERTARAATEGPWQVDNEQHAEAITTPTGTVVVGGGRWGGEAPVFETTQDALHIARHDPARVLAEVDAKRQFLKAYEAAPSRPAETDSQLHARFAHPAWEYSTTKGPRKQWADASTPPYGDDGEPDTTWEPNTDAGIDGWERFDYTEESYWRRRRPEGQERRTEIPTLLRLLALPFADHPAFQDAWRP
ncbi:DUF6221 family protein [Streptomyces zaomyceticus]|uniref:DUF6221 family protein n=1 Tax=Streptomyces zaomyceticus TaxID=68286 RepID=UPI0037A49E9C